MSYPTISEPIMEDAEVVVDLGDEGQGEGEAPAPGQPPPEPAPEPAVTAPTGEPGGEGEGGATAPPEAALPPDHYVWRYRDQEQRIPRQTIEQLRGSLGVDSDEAVLRYLADGRDLAYAREEARRQAEERMEQLQQYEAMLHHQAGQLQARARAMGMSGQGTPAPRAGGYPGTGARGPSGPAGGYAPPAPARPAATAPRGNYPPELAEVLDIPARMSAFEDRVIGILTADRDERANAQFQNDLRESGARIVQEATEFLSDLKKDGWVLPDDITPSSIIQDANRYGLSGNRNIPWREAFETVTARRLYRSGFTTGQAAAAARLTTDRAAGYRTPRLPGTATPPPVGVGAGAPDALAAARAAGQAVTMREASGGY